MGKILILIQRLMEVLRSLMLGNGDGVGDAVGLHDKTKPMQAP